MNEMAIRDYWNRVAGLPQRFGVYDCCTFVVETLLYGFDRDYRDALMYFDRRSAVVRLRRSGGLRDAFCDILGPESLCQGFPPGSVAYFQKPASVGIIMRDYIALKGHGKIHKVQFDPNQTGWKT